MELEEAIKKCEDFLDENKSRAKQMKFIKKEYIPKKKIENEIEILKAQCGGNVFHIQQILNAEIRLLQDLLKDK